MYQTYAKNLKSVDEGINSLTTPNKIGEDIIDESRFHKKNLNFPAVLCIRIPSNLLCRLQLILICRKYFLNLN